MHLTIHGMEMRFLNSSNVSLSLPLSLTSKVKFHNSRMISSELNTFGYHESFVCEILWILNHGSKYWSWRSHDTWIFYANIISRLRLWNFQLYPCANHDIYKKYHTQSHILQTWIIIITENSKCYSNFSTGISSYHVKHWK